MLKKIRLVLVFVAVVTGGVFAEQVSGIEESKFFINGGIGFGFLPYTMSLPAISASVEYGLPTNVPLSVGGYFGMTGYEQKVTTYSSYKGTRIAFGARVSWNFSLIKDLLIQGFDTYVSLVLGYMIYNQEVKNTTPGSGGEDDTTVTDEYDFSTFYYGGCIGARYFFTQNIGVYLELGYSAVSVFSAGLALKF